MNSTGFIYAPGSGGSSYPVARWVSDGSNSNPLDGSVQYFGTLNNVNLAGANTYQPQCKKQGGIFHVVWQDFVGGTLASSQGCTITLYNITQGTSEVLTTNHLLTDRVNSSYLISTLAFDLGDYLALERTHPTYTTNPTVVYPSIEIKEY